MHGKESNNSKSNKPNQAPHLCVGSSGAAVVRVRSAWMCLHQCFVLQLCEMQGHCCLHTCLTDSKSEGRGTSVWVEELLPCALILTCAQVVLCCFSEAVELVLLLKRNTIMLIKFTFALSFIPVFVN